MDGNLLLIDTSSGSLFKANPDGKVLARAELEMPAHPVLRLHAGLLLINSPHGTGIRVFRYETSAFAQQLDEILLLPPAALEAKQSVVSDFVWSGGVWWASLNNPESGSMGLYRFDEDWNYLQHVLLPIDNGTVQLTSWGEKTLANNSHSLAIQRFSAQGTIEAPLISSQLKTLISRQQQRARLATAGWLAALLICGLGVLGTCRDCVDSSINHTESAAQNHWTTTQIHSTGSTPCKIGQHCCDADASATAYWQSPQYW